jgi:predicted O-methyltransferase YrrM
MPIEKIFLLVEVDRQLSRAFVLVVKGSNLRRQLPPEIALVFFATIRKTAKPTTWFKFVFHKFGLNFRFMDFLLPAIEGYAEAHSAPESELLQRLHRETHAKVMMPRMLSGRLQGNALQMFARMIQPKRILEIGTFTGYSAICLAQGLAPDGLLHTIDINEELETMIRRYIAEAGLADKISLHVGNALDIIPQLDEQFDLVFIDADKINYQRYYDLVFDKVKKGGFIIADNVLWSGKVLNDKMDKDTLAIHQFNEYVHQDTRVFHFLLPLRDGLLIAQKLA